MITVEMRPSHDGANHKRMPGIYATARSHNGARCLMLTADFLSILGGVVKFDFTASALLRGVHDAGIEGAGIDVQADCSLIEFARIENAVDGLERIHGTGLSWI